MDGKIILYILFIVLWAAYKYYQNSHKVKNTQQPVIGTNKSATDSHQKIPTSREEKYKSIFEKILLGEEFTAPAKTKDSEVLDNPVLDNETLNTNYQESNPAELKETIKTEEISPTSKVFKTFEVSKFNLKQALIYSVILNRPYQ